MSGTFRLKKRTDGQYYWSLVASNGETLCHSEGYTTKQSAQNGIDACRRFAPTAKVSDDTNRYSY